MRASVLSLVTKFLSVAALVGASVTLGATVSSAAATNGVISGVVTECAPGPIIYAPNKPAPRPKPVTITLRRAGKPFASQSVKFPTLRGWTGTFDFRVPSGLYEVLASSQGYPAKWVKLQPATHRTVNFGHFACPL